MFWRILVKLDEGFFSQVKEFQEETNDEKTKRVGPPMRKRLSKQGKSIGYDLGSHHD
jgi:hypothetical protein